MTGLTSAAFFPVSRASEVVTIFDCIYTLDAGYLEPEALDDVIAWLRRELLIDAATAREIVRKYGANAPKVVRDDPYIVAEQIRGIGFRTADRIAEALGISLTRGIPVAIFFDPEGAVIGTTNDGQLEPARHYSSKQILKFVRDIAERSRILAPDSVE